MTKETVTFEPIAIVGQGCVLPGARAPEALWDLLLNGKNVLSDVAPDYWQAKDVLTDVDKPSGDKTWTTRGSYVRDFDQTLPDSVKDLDEVFQWTMAAALQAWNPIWSEPGSKKSELKGGVILGNLSYPTHAMSRFAESIWRGNEPREDARNRFMSGLPPKLIRDHLGLKGSAFSLDAACASSLYAIKLACDELHAGTADVMLAGGVNHADDLFLHIGFCALNAMSRTGQSRPFHDDADGLIPAEGCAFVSLMRLDDAVRRGENIAGVIRGIGVSNDGRSRGMLTPSEDGQERAMRHAYAISGVDPSEVSFVECHATGTPLGDGIELASMARVFPNAIKLGSMKSNLGHLITASGVTGLLKMLGAMKHATLPPTINVDKPLAAIADTPFELVTESQPWEPSAVAVNNFGFGGNNAHLIVEPFNADKKFETKTVKRVKAHVTKTSGFVGNTNIKNIEKVNGSFSAKCDAIDIDIAALKFPPNDLNVMLPKQLAVLMVAFDLEDAIDALPKERTGVYIGMQTDTEITRYGARWRNADGDDGVVGMLNSAGVLGTMPNIVTNRINTQFNISGPSFSVCDGADSGLTALRLAEEAIGRGEIDAAIVGATEMGCDPVHTRALELMGIDKKSADACILFVLKREDLVTAEEHSVPLTTEVKEFTRGYAHAAQGAIEKANFLKTAAPEIVVTERRQPKVKKTFSAHWPVVTFSKPRPVFANLQRMESAPRLLNRNDVSAWSVPIPIVSPKTSSPIFANTTGAAAKNPQESSPQGAPQAFLRAALPTSAQQEAGKSRSISKSAAAVPAGQGDPKQASMQAQNASVNELFEDVSTMHAQFLAEQTAMHQKFLNFQNNIMSALAGTTPECSAPNTTNTTGAAAANPHGGSPQGAPQAFSERPWEVVQSNHQVSVAPYPKSAAAVPAGQGDQKTGPQSQNPYTVGDPRTGHRITPSSAKPNPTGPTFNYDQIHTHASGKISDVYGPLFKQQDDYAVQVRMPEPSLLLCDRVTGIDCEPGVVSTGSLWCESDIPEDAWYLHANRMPVGIMIESGQADLMLCSWMGADFENKGERCYRLLGCELMFHGGLAKPGDTLAYDIHIDAHARQNDIRLFFFHYDLEIDNQVRLSVRHGQAGFFTYDELGESKGVIWDPMDEDMEAMRATPFDPHPCVTQKRSFTRQELEHFAAGNTYDVFGNDDGRISGFERAAAHSASPTIADGKMLFMDEVNEFDPTGGPWGRGYLKATQHISADDWFFPGHFKNDPCMPGTLMFEGAVQTMAFYLSACGWTIDRDGWIFEPVQEIPYLLRCRGQVSVTSKELTYEVFVREVHDGPTPMLFADLMCTVDGLSAFHCARMGLQLTPAWPMDQLAETPLLDDPNKTPPAVVNGHTFGIDSLTACAWGTPSRAFGEMYEPFDSHRTVARLPGPPYHFISRVTEIDPAAQNAMKSDVELKVHYDVPSDSSHWYFKENGAEVMPYAVLLEAALQPCGWLASYVGCALTRDDIDLCFRNLDGTNTQFKEVTPQTGTLVTKAFLKTVARAAGNIIVAFDVEMRELETDDLVLTMDAVFGFFPPSALAEQVGLPVSDEEREKHDEPSNHDVRFQDRPEKFCTEGKPKLAEEMLRMIDVLDYFDPKGGAHGLGRARAQKTIDPREWFFKAHFFQDPVQPGSLGLEALLQLLQATMIELGLTDSSPERTPDLKTSVSTVEEQVQKTRFEALAIDKAMSWKYRGQVLTHNKIVTSTIDITEIGQDDLGTYALAEGSLWVDGMRIYSASNIGMRIVKDDGTVRAKNQQDAPHQMRVSAVDEQTQKTSAAQVQKIYISAVAEQAQTTNGFVIDPVVHRWLADHCPTYTKPALPAMSIIDLMATRVTDESGQRILAVKDVKIEKWVIFSGPERLRVTTEKIDDSTYKATLEMWWRAPRSEMSRFDRVASATITVGAKYQRSDARPRSIHGELSSPYASGELFHGPAFQLLTSVVCGDRFAAGELDLSLNGVPIGTVQPGVLDAALQIIPHDNMGAWHKPATDVIAYPFAISELIFHNEKPTGGLCRSEVTFVGGDDRFVDFDISIFHDGRIWATMKLREVLVPKGPIGSLSGADRKRFIVDREYIPAARLSSESGELDRETVVQSNWFRGTVESIYDVSGLADAVVQQIVIKDRAAKQFKVHPSKFDVSGNRARPKFAPVVAFDENGFGHVDLHHIKQWWRNKLDVPSGWLGDDLYGATIGRFVSEIRVENLASFEEIYGRPALFLGNHECQIESVIITMLGSVLSNTNVLTMANAKHEGGWVGGLIRDMFSYPGCVDPRNIVYFNRNDPASMRGLIDGFKHEIKTRNASIMVHAPGTRAIQAGQPVENLSSVFLDLALDANLPIVPVYFDAGLPVDPLHDHKLEFPIGQTGQSYSFGTPILPEVLGAFEYKDRRGLVIDAINRLAPKQSKPNPPVASYIREIAKLRSEGWDEINATLFNLLSHVESPDRDATRLVEMFSSDAQPENERDAWIYDFVKRRFRI